jgi:hypothetical protein
MVRRNRLVTFAGPVEIGSHPSTCEIVTLAMNCDTGNEWIADILIQFLPSRVSRVAGLLRFSPYDWSIPLTSSF